MQAKQPALVFCVAAPEDATWLIQWEKHLLPLQRAGYLHLWSERLLLVGENRAQQMNQQIDQADLIVFLLSPDFFASEECLTLMERALTRQQDEQVSLVPLLLRPSTWQDSPLGSLSYLPQQARPITVWGNTDEAFQTCIESIRQLLGLPTREGVKKRQCSFPPTQRLQVIHALQQEYRQRRDHSLQGQATIELGLHERTDVIASSARLVFHDAEIERTLPTGTTIIQVYDDTQRGLLILGAPGAGKTTLLLDLVLELLDRAENDAEHPLPIILSLSSWGMTKLALVDWLREQLYLVYGIARKVSTSWIEQDHILFLLDGLDEMDLSARSSCVAAINHYRSEHFVPLVVSSRSREYEQQQARLILPAAVEIQPLEPTRISAYLKQAGQELVAVRTVLQNNTSLQFLITTPLLLMIVLLTYRDWEAHELVQERSPEDQRRLIFQHYVQRMLERHHCRRTISTSHLLRSLRWLAQNMQKRHLTEFYLEQLQPTWLGTKHVQTVYHLLYELLLGLLTGLLIGIVAGLSYGLFAGLSFGFLATLVVALVAGLGFGLLRGLFVGIVCGLLIGSVFGILSGLPDGLSFGGSAGSIAGVFSGLSAGLLTERGSKLAEKVTWSRRGCGTGMLFGYIGGLILGLIPLILYAMPVSFLYALPFYGLYYGLPFALIFGLFGGLSGTSMNPDLRRRPNQGIHISGLNAVRFGLVFLLAFGLLAGLIAGLLGGGLEALLIVGLLGGLFGVFFGVLFGGGAIYLQHYILRFLLWRGSALPWQTIPLLEEATDCILLQRVGGGYRFIHPALQEHFASLDVEAVLGQKITPSKSSATKHPT